MRHLRLNSKQKTHEASKVMRRPASTPLISLWPLIVPSFFRSFGCLFGQELSEVGRGQPTPHLNHKCHFSTTVLTLFPSFFHPRKTNPFPPLQNIKTNEQIPGWFRDELTSHTVLQPFFRRKKRNPRRPVRTLGSMWNSQPVYTLILRGATNQHATSASTNKTTIQAIS